MAFLLKKQPFRIDRFLTLFLFGPLSRFTSLPKNYGIPILMYHKISDADEPGVHPYYKLCTSPNRFRQHMRFLQARGYQVISLKEAVKLSSIDLSLSTDHPKYVVLTFDDGYQDFYINAWPILKELGYPVTVFVPTAFIRSRLDSSSDKSPILPNTFSFTSYSSSELWSVTDLLGNFADNIREFHSTPIRYPLSTGGPCGPFLTWDQIFDLHRQGVDFGSHTVTHAQLHGLDDWSKVRRELSDSKKCLQEVLGTEVQDFSYPYAYPQNDRNFCLKLSHTLKECGYKTCVTTSIGVLSPGINLFAIKRLPINDDDDLLLFHAKLKGLYNWVGVFQSIVKRAKWLKPRG